MDFRCSFLGEIQKILHCHCYYHLPKMLSEQRLSKTTAIPRKEWLILSFWGIFISEEQPQSQRNLSTTLCQSVFGTGGLADC